MQKELKRLFDYKDGHLVRKTTVSHNAKVGSVAGSLDRQSGYRRLSINNKSYHEHRLIWIWHNGDIENQIDHINHDRSDNRIENLRVASQRMNMRNTKRRVDNMSGSTGVSFCITSGKWVAYINTARKRITLGYSESKINAIYIRKMAEQKYRYHPNHGKAK